MYIWQEDFANGILWYDLDGPNDKQSSVKCAKATWI